MNNYNGIITEKRAEDWIAHLDWDKRVYESGQTEVEAIGKLWVSASDQIIDYFLGHHEPVKRDLDAEIRHVQETALTDTEVDKQIEAYNAEIDARRKLQADAREKPWLPIQPGEEF